MIQISALLGNGQKLDGGSMFGNAPRPVWEKWIAPDELGRIPLACRALLIEYNAHKILCETGIGAFFDAKMAERFGVQNPDRHLLLENLKSIGVDAKDITHVVLSHLHFDHAGGLLPSFQDMANGNAGLAFPNATVIASRKAYERGVEPHSRDRASFIPELMKRLKSAQLELIDDPHSKTLFDGRMSFYTSDGHTPGQMHVMFQGHKEAVVFCADLIPGRPWIHTPITMGYDRFPELLIDEKETLYKKMDLEKTNFFFTHDSDVAMSKITKDERGKFFATNEVAHPLRYVL